MTTSSNPAELLSPGAVKPTAAKPIVWWAAGGLGLLGAGALAAVLVTGPKNDALPTPKEVPAKQLAAAAKPAAAKPVKTAKASDHKVAAASICANCGVVDSVAAVKTKGEATGMGAVGGAVLGGVVGHQLGGGDGKKALTVLGAVGGGFAGNEVEKRARSTSSFEVRLRMDDGSIRTVPQGTAPAVGTRFRVEGDQLKPLAAAKG